MNAKLEIQLSNGLYLAYDVIHCLVNSIFREPFLRLKIGTHFLTVVVVKIVPTYMNAKLEIQLSNGLYLLYDVIHCLVNSIFREPFLPHLMPCDMPIPPSHPL